MTGAEVSQCDAPPWTGFIPIRDGPDPSLLHRLDRCAVVVPSRVFFPVVRSPRARRWRLGATLPWSIVRHSQHKPVRGPGGRARMLTGERTVPTIEIPTQSDPIRIGCRAGSNLPVAPPFMAGQWPRRNSIPFSLAHFYECLSRQRDEPHPFTTSLGRTF